MKKIIRATITLYLVAAILFSFAGTAFAGQGFTTVCPFKGTVFTHDAANRDAVVKPMLDISQFQGKVNFYKLKEQGVEHVILRAGHRYSTSGVIGEDERFYENIENAIAAGIEVGVYVFSQALTPQEAVEEAEYCIARVAKYREAVTLPIFMDYEFYSGNAQGRLSTAWGNGTLNKAKMTQNAIAFCERVIRAGYKPGVYANASFYTTCLDGDALYENGYAIWYAHYTDDITTFDYWGNSHPVYTFWQYGGTEVTGCCGDPAKAWLRVAFGDTTGFMLAQNVIFSAANTASVNAQGTKLYKAKSTGAEVSMELPVGGRVEILNYLTSVATDTNFYYYRNAQPLAKPVFSLTGTSSTSVTIAWDEVSGADFYRVYAYERESETYTTVVENTTQTTVVLTGLEPDSEHSYLVRAFNRSGANSAYTNKDVKTISLAMILEPSDTQVRMHWLPVENAKKYMVFRVEEGDALVFLGETQETEFTLTGLSPATAYRLLVLAFDAQGNSEEFRLKNIKSVTTLAAHKHLAAVPVKENEKAADCTQAGSYDEVVYCAECHAELSRQTKRIEKTAHEYETVRKKATAIECGYTARTCTHCGTKVFDTYTAPTGKLTLKHGGRNASALKVNWNNIKTATGYQVQISTKDGKKWATYANLKAGITVYTFKNLAAGNTYKFRARFYIKAADGKKYYSPWSATLLSPTLPSGTAITKLSAGNKTFTAQWKKAGFTGYQLQYGLKSNFSGAKTVTIKNAKTLKTTIKKFSAKKAYFVRIRTFKTVSKVNFYSAWSKAYKVKTK